MKLFAKLLAPLFAVALTACEDVPAPYEVDKVVEKLKERASQSCAVLFAAGIEEAISIIKAGEQDDYR